MPERASTLSERWFFFNTDNSHISTKEAKNQVYVMAMAYGKIFRSVLYDRIIRVLYFLQGIDLMTVAAYTRNHFSTFPERVFMLDEPVIVMFCSCWLLCAVNVTAPTAKACGLLRF